MNYSEDNILTNSALLIIYKDGNFTLIPKMKGFDCHINYIDYEIRTNNNLKLSELLNESDIKSVLDNPYEFLKIINSLTLNGNILLTNFACNYVGPTNYFSAYLPENISEEQYKTINNLKLYLKELEFDHIAQYNLEYKRVKGIESLDLLEVINKKIGR